MDYQEIKVSSQDKITNIILDNPKSMNALSLAMAREIIDAVKIAQNEARVIILSGAGNAFCSGANLSGERMGDLQKGDVGIALDEVYNPLLIAIKQSGIPIICAINGPAVGIGCPLALMGDLIIAQNSAYFMQGFLNIALIPDGGSAYLLARTIGRTKAMEMMLLGNKLSAQEAYNRGLITQICEDGKSLETAQNIANKITQGPKEAIALMRQSAWAALDNDYLTQLNLERQLQKKAGNNPDFIEGVTAFMQKRAPKFND
jgi:2-(1,2-epoxy-1,2-dihydrophenyl)acetyl-CoA isomerase